MHGGEFEKGFGHLHDVNDAHEADEAPCQWPGHDPRGKGQGRPKHADWGGKHPSQHEDGSKGCKGEGFDTMKALGR